MKSGLVSDHLISETIILSDHNVISYSRLRKRDGDKKVALRGLGTFKLVDTPAKPRRKGRNPATGEEIMLKAKPKGRKVKVLVNKGLRDTLKAS